MKHFSHDHLLILNEEYIAWEGDVCRGCNDQIISCKSFVYSCSRITASISTDTSATVDDECFGFLLHKTCAELPPRLQMQLLESCAEFPKELLKEIGVKFLLLRSTPIRPDVLFKVEDNIKDLSYKCTLCQFWIHKSCADAPTSFLFQFHDQHPLFLTFSLPKVYHKFSQYCKLCHETLNRLNWLYYCPKCRFFVHFHCARSKRMLSSSENVTNPNLVHLPGTYESSLIEQFVKAVSALDHSILGTTKRIMDWAHSEHHLQLITHIELHDQKDIDEMLLLCDGCVKPIQAEGQLFYGCVPCIYFLHKVCAELPREIEHHLWPGKKFFALKCGEPANLKCNVCRNICNGIVFGNCGTNLHSANIKLHIECAMLPKMIKHEAHPHQLTQLYTPYYGCKACGRYDLQYKHGCKNCDFYICGGCIIKARTFKHRWDPHPLQLIYDPSMVMDHEHEFNCELCSEDIDTNFWFYHCSDCDLTFHERCAVTNKRFTASEGFHPHPLILSSSLPTVYRKFTRHCRLCNRKLNPSDWIYYCLFCTYFIHVDCGIKI